MADNFDREDRIEEIGKIKLNLKHYPEKTIIVMEISRMNCLRLPEIVRR